MADGHSAEHDDSTISHGLAAKGSSANPAEVGPYRILRKIGEGGMGIVYEAEQERPVRRRVALKLIKWGMDTHEVIARFESERQALALMNHASIARVYDAGATSEGRPYFAMEYVAGLPVTEYCDKFRLPIRERLRLFVDVCEGVQHAHQKGIIHRDIKPSNVLVTTEGDKPVPKIIDFGVAKATSQRLSEHTVFTQHGQLVGTPAYMSPEQADASNLDIDTRTDVYSLGVLLYELLAGKRPFEAEEFRKASLAEIQKKLREVDPPRPSSRVTGPGEESATSASNRRADPRALERSLRGDLDWITMKALEKDRSRRYETAHALALDIERHLSDQPVTAGPPSALYHAGKLFRRHRGTFLAAGFVAAALAAGIVGTTWAMLRARRQTAIAEAVSTFLREDLLAAAAPSAAKGKGRTATVRDALDAAAERIDQASKSGGRFAGEPIVEAAVRYTLGSTYEQLGEYKAAEPHVRRALELRRSTLGEDHADTIAATNLLGAMQWRQGRLPEAETLYLKAYETSKRQLGADHPSTLVYERNLANLYRTRRQYKNADPLFEHNVEATIRVKGADHPDTLDAISSVANHYQETGRFEKAEALHRHELEIRRRKDGDKSPRTVSAMNNLANDLALLGRYKEADVLAREALAIKIVVFGENHPSTLNSVSNVADAADALGNDAEAERFHRQAFEGRLRVLGPAHPRTLYSRERLAIAITSQGRFAEAASIAEGVAARSAKELGAGHLQTVEANDTLAVALTGLGQAAKAESILRRQLTSIAEMRKKGEDAESEIDVLRDRVRFHLGMALAAQGRRAEAETEMVESVKGLGKEAAAIRAWEFLAAFYEDWNKSKPDPERAARAAEWQARVKSASP